MKVKSSRQECPLHTGLRLGLHVGAEDGVDAGLVSRGLPEPAEQVSVQAHGYDLFRRGRDYFGGLPEVVVSRKGVGVCLDALADSGRPHAIEPAPVGT